MLGPPGSSASDDDDDVCSGHITHVNRLLASQGGKLQSTCSDDLTNFCSSWFVSSVSCNTVTADGHSCSNLISDDPQRRSRGLRVEHYIRPPVVISMDLCVPVNVSYVLISPDLSPHAELRLELSGSANTEEGGNRLLSPGALVGRSGCLLVARSKQCRENNTTQEAVVMPRLENMVVQNSYGYKDLKQSALYECVLKNDNVLRHLRHLQLKVFKWTGPKPVSIKWVEIWGVLSNRASRQERNMFRSRYRASMDSVESKSGHAPGMFTCTMRNDTSSLQTHQSRKVEHQGGVAPVSALSTKDEVPEHFLDELTFEVMVLPMLLPSGHCVDQTTLDRLVVSDASYGRPPSDPFTGIPFTEKCKPEFCAELKAQLDHFMGQNKTCSYGVSRTSGATVGSSAEIRKHLLRTSRTLVGSSEGSLSSASKRVKLDEELPCDCCADRGIGSELPAPGACTSACASTQGTNHRPNTGPAHNKTLSNFDLQVGNSLDLALDQVLNNSNSNS